MTARRHRHQDTYPALWTAIDGAIRDACNAHDDIKIPDKRRASIVKHAVGEVLSLQWLGAGQPAETAEGHQNAPANGVHVPRAEGLAKSVGQPQPITEEHDG